MYLWEQRNWPHFEWDESVLRPTLDAVRLLQWRVSGQDRSGLVYQPESMKLKLVEPLRPCATSTKRPNEILGGS